MLNEETHGGLIASLKGAGDEKELRKVYESELQDLLGDDNDLNQKIGALEEFLDGPVVAEKSTKQRLQSKDHPPSAFKSGSISFAMPTTEEQIVDTVHSTRDLLQKMSEKSTLDDWKESSFLSVESQGHMKDICGSLAELCETMLNEERLYYDPEYDGEGQEAVAKASFESDGPEILFGKQFPQEAPGPLTIAVIHELTHISDLKTKDVAYRHDPLLDRLSHMKGPKGSLELSNADSVAHGIYQCALKIGNGRLGLILPLEGTDLEAAQSILTTSQKLALEKMAPEQKEDYLDCRALAERLADIAQDVTPKEDPAKNWLAKTAEHVRKMSPAVLLEMADGQTMGEVIMQASTHLSPAPDPDIAKKMQEALSYADEVAQTNHIPTQLVANVNHQLKNSGQHSMSVGSNIKVGAPSPGSHLGANV